MDATAAQLDSTECGTPDPEIRPQQQLISRTVAQAIDDATVPAFRLAKNPGSCAMAKDQATAIRWIFSDQQHEFSFLWCMAMLGQDDMVDEIRRNVREAPARVHRNMRSVRGSA